MTKRVVYSGNQLGWLTATANLLMDRSADQAPLSMQDLLRRVPDQVGTARNDGHVTAAENGLDRNDYKAGYEIWIDGVLQALRYAKLVTGPNDALEWTGDPTKTHKVKFYGKTYSVPDREPRRESRDRYMLGEPGKDWKAPSLGADGRVLRGDTPPLVVKVRTHWRGEERIHTERLEIHPLALAIPPMTVPEQKAIRADIEQNGVKVPVVIYPDANDLTAKGKPKRKVLDGRHRTYFASVTDQPIELEEFQGTEADARAYVYSLNAIRRHLTIAQRNLLAIEMFETEAEKEAAEAQREAGIKGNQSRAGVGHLADTGNGRKPAESTNKRIADKAGPGVTERTVQRMRAAGIHADARDKLPDTVTNIDAGKATSAAAAVRDASAEQKQPTPDLPPDYTITEAVGHVRSKVGALLKVLDLANSVPGARGPGENIDVLLEARTGIDSAISELQRRSS